MVSFTYLTGAKFIPPGTRTVGPTRRRYLNLKYLFFEFEKKIEFFDRNQILTVWNDNPGQEVTLENATTRITKIEYQNPALISKVKVAQALV